MVSVESFGIRDVFTSRGETGVIAGCQRQHASSDGVHPVTYVKSMIPSTPGIYQDNFSILVEEEKYL
jgi:hypothetical protein